MTEGPCAYCSEDAIVTIRGVALCLKHYNERKQGK
jgi:hypothetical protein